MFYFFFFFDNICHLDVHYVCMLVQHFEPQGRRFTVIIIIIIIMLRTSVDCAV